MAALRKEGYVVPLPPIGAIGWRKADRLTEGTVRPWLHGELGKNLLCLDCIDSTNNYLKRLALEGAPDCTVAVADEQTAGRGRLGRSFQSPPGTGIYLSILLRPAVVPEKAVNPDCLHGGGYVRCGAGRSGRCGLRSNGRMTFCWTSGRSAAF